jgi:hypothetical protein
MSPISNSVLHQPPLLRQLMALGVARPGAAGQQPVGRDGKGPGTGTGSVSGTVRKTIGHPGPTATKHRPSLAQRLAPWLAWSDAIALAGALAAAAPAPASPARAAAAARDAVFAYEQARHALAQAIDLDEPEGVDLREWPADATPGRRYRAHQQAMAARIDPLRRRVRAALAAQSAALGRVAMLDQRIEQALGTRERQLLAALPGWLDHRLKRDPAPPHEVMQPLLHAELTHRLQPVGGMLSAMSGGGHAA